MTVRRCKMIEVKRGDGREGRKRGKQVKDVRYQ
jgi:hypothetical protein